MMGEHTKSQVTVHRRNLPHWSLEDSTYFVTFRLRSGTLNHDERQIVLQHIQSGHEKYYRLAATVVMPDHVHLIIRPMSDYELSRIMKGIKGTSARQINLRRGSAGHVWQDESWDRILRDQAEFEEKLNCMLDNPLKAGLVKPGEAYQWWWCQQDAI